MTKSNNLASRVADISDAFEKENSELKKQYIISNIILYNNIAGVIKECKGTFGTGYPFYVLKKDFSGALPIIDEQLRYNDELRQNAERSGLSEWFCETCLSEKGFTMPDLKQICKACPGMDKLLKPRELIKRLPDIDMWAVCSDEDMAYVSETLARVLTQNGFKTSDVDPVKTIYEMQEIVSKLQSNKMPLLKLPIDTHLVDNVTLYTLISQIPDTLDSCMKKGDVPFIPIHPLSLRKTWQRDDVAYNFVHDYLSSFSEFKMDPQIQQLLNETRKEVAKRYSFDKLYEFLIQTGPSSVKRRHKTKELKETFRERIESWREL